MASRMKTVGMVVTLLTPCIFGISSNAIARNVVLNGVDVSSARNQDIENVTVRIDGDGNIFIIAPHYQVNEESTYIPLSSWKHSPGAPQNKNPGAISNNPGNLPSHPAIELAKTGPGGKSAEEPKPGTKSSPSGATEEGISKDNK